jgi:hypothetical protein
VTRRLISLIAASAMLFALLPAGMALAAATATAEIRSATSVYPGDRTFSIRVANGEAPIIGRSINAVRVFYPVAEAGVKAPDTASAPLGWTAQVTKLGDTQYVTYRSGRISPGSSTDFSVPAEVARPLGRDLVGDFRVQVSSDNFATSRNATATGNGLDAAVRILEVVAGTVRPTAPTNADNSKGVTDRKGTAGQTITYSFDVKNHAQNSVTVTPALSVAQGSPDVPGTASSASVAGMDGIRTFNAPLTLGPAPSADRNTVVTATATSTGSSAPGRNDTFTVQVPVDLSFSNLRPVRVRSGEGSATDFRINLSKTGSPAFDFTSSTLSFGSNSQATTDLPTTLGTGNRSSALEYSFLQLSGPNGGFAELQATTSNLGTDHNLASYTLNKDVGTIIIDNLKPLLTIDVTLPNDRDGHQQIASKNGDRITVSGTVVGQPANNDYQSNTLKVTLVPDVGSPITVPATLSQNSDGSATFTGTSPSTSWDANATRFQASVEIADVAGNVGGTTSSFEIIDLLPPVLQPGLITSPRSISLVYQDDTGLRGGCSASAYLIDGTPGLVQSVLDGSGEGCDAATLSTDGTRILVLRQEAALPVDATPNVTYDGAALRLAGSVPAKDGAGNDAGRQTVRTINDLVPPLPNLIDVNRRSVADADRWEAAYKDADEDAYYTGRGGEDGVEVTVGRARNGFIIEVLDGAGRVIGTKTVTKSNPSPFASEVTDTILVPLGANDGAYARGIRFRGANGRIGEVLPLTIVLDTVAPRLSLTQLTDATTVKVTLSEKIVAGSNFADDWFVTEQVTTESGTASRTVNVNEVEATDAFTRTLTVTLRDPSRFQRVDYFLQHPEGRRYEDRAGNLLVNTLGG